jgi:two-component system, chemotaxis family, CheB/CheR fusion protein
MASMTPYPQEKEMVSKKPTNPALKKSRPVINKKPDLKGEPSQPQSFSIVGMGGSAGGLEAFEQFFSKMPSDTGTAFVVVPHLDPTHASLMTELLKRVTRMEVTEAKEGTRVKPDCVYVIPPNKEMTIFHGVLSLDLPKVAHGLRMPIDTFLRSLADDQGELAVGIILSGTGMDGTLGLRAIHGSGGMVMVQDPKTAKYAGMPGSAVQTGLADYVLPAEKMPESLTAYVRKFAKEGKPPITETKGVALQKILAVVRSRTHHDFTLYKKTTITRRIRKRMNLHAIDDIDTYVRLLQEHSEEVHALFKDLLIGVTQFFRDPEAFEILKRKILSKYIEGKPESYTLRVWVPGCGSGEEAYSIAMVLAECIEESKRDVKIQIFGTDIDEDAIGKARGGLYSGNIAADVSPQRLKRFFAKEDGMYRLKKEIRELVVFAIQDIVIDPPFTKLDLLSCRNLLIYMETELQNRLFPLFHYSLKPEGTLFLGTSETTGKFVDLFEVLERKWKIFRSRNVALPLQEETWTALPWTHTAIVKEMEERRPRPVDVDAVAQSALLNTFCPPSVIVDGSGEIKFVHGQTGKYLQPAPGHASLNVLDMAREGIKHEIRLGIHHATTKMKERVYRGLRVKTNGEYQPVNLTVKPLIHPKEVQGLVMVVFEEPAPLKPKDRRKKEMASRKKDISSQDLEQELTFTRETLQATIEELQASNEELKSTNEELQSTNEEFQSTNEELETSREELQSVNEELVTLNSELQSKIDQLSQAENDMKILLDSTNIGIIFLDTHLCIKRFTSEATKVLHLIPTDIGRPMHDIRTDFEYDNIEKDAQKVLDTLEAKELELRTKDGSWYLMRIIPYRAAENVIEGVVITFTETTQLKEREYKAATLYAEVIAETVREPFLILSHDSRIITANPAFYRSFHVSKADTEGRLLFEIGNRQWNIPKLKRLLEKILPSNQKFHDFLVEHEFPGVGLKRMLLNARRIEEQDPNLRPLILLAIEDVTDHKQPA